MFKMEEQDMDMYQINRWISWFGSVTSASWLISKKKKYIFSSFIIFSIKKTNLET